MKVDFLPSGGKFYKVNMHCHTTISDGKQTREEVKALYQSLGYDAVCFTDHEVLLGHEDLSTTQIYTHLVSKNLQDAMENNPLSDFSAKKR